MKGRRKKRSRRDSGLSCGNVQVISDAAVGGTPPLGAATVMVALKSDVQKTDVAGRAAEV